MQDHTLLTLANTQVENAKIKAEVKVTLDQIVEECQFRLQCGPFFNYFISKTKQENELLRVNKKYNHFLQQKIQREIETGQVKVSRQKKSFILAQKPKVTEREFLEQEKRMIQKKKKQALQSLHQVLQQQNILFSKKLGKLRNSKSEKNKSLTRLQEIPNWKDELTKAVLKNRAFNSSLEKRTVQVKEKLQQMKREDQINKLKLIQDIKKKNHEQIQLRKRREQQGKKKQIEYLKQCEECLHKVKPKRYLHDMIEQKKAQSMRKTELQRKMKLEEIKRYREINNWSDLKDHEQNYMSTLSEHREKWHSQFFEMIQSHKSRLKHYDGLYANKIKEEQFELKQLERKEQLKGFEILQKIKSYSEYVGEKFKPKIMIKPVNPENQLKQSYKRQSLGRFQSRAKGLQYLTTVKESVKSSKRAEEKNEPKVSRPASLPIIKTTANYKDYLRDQPKRKKFESSSQHFQSVLSQQKGEWASSALNLISKMETVNKKQGAKPLIDSAFHKIELLNAMF